MAVASCSFGPLSGVGGVGAGGHSLARSGLVVVVVCACVRERKEEARERTSGGHQVGHEPYEPQVKTQPTNSTTNTHANSAPFTKQIDFFSIRKCWTSLDSRKKCQHNQELASARNSSSSQPLRAAAECHPMIRPLRHVRAVATQYVGSVRPCADHTAIPVHTVAQICEKKTSQSVRTNDNTVLIAFASVASSFARASAHLLTSDFAMEAADGHLRRGVLLLVVCVLATGLGWWNHSAFTLAGLVLLLPCYY